MRNSRRRAVLAWLMFSQLTLSAIALAQTSPPDQCASLAGSSLPNMAVTLAQWNLATATVAAHCEVVGEINARVGVDGMPYAIRFHLRLPQIWNERFYFQGGGGTDGNIGNALGGTALATGFSVVSTNAGHDNAINNDPNAGGSAAFGIDPQARSDYGYNAIGVVTPAAKALIEHYYGQPPDCSYFVGCSNGGRQGMVASQRFPHYFDGIIAGDPGFNLPQAGVAEAYDSQAFADVARELGAFDPSGQPLLTGTFSNADLALVADGVLASCDGLDGLEDGMVNNFPRCRFNPRTLQCPGAKEAGCLSAALVKALRKVFSGAQNSRGQSLYADWPWDSGIRDFGWRIWKIGVPNTPVNTAINLTLGGAAVPLVFMNPPDVVPTSGLVEYMLNFDFDRDAPRIFRRHAGIYRESPMQFMSANDVNLSNFKQSGGKMILYHGVSDPVFSINDTIDWYEKVNRRHDGKASRFVRLFAVPGMAHCGGGPATSQFDAFGALTDWVERGIAPGQILATAPATTPWPGRTRPLCPYPTQPRYRGEGGIEDAANFECVRPHSVKDCWDDH